MGNEQQVIVMLFGVVALLVVCQLPRFCINVHNTAIFANLSCCQALDPSLGMTTSNQVFHMLGRLALLINRSAAAVPSYGSIMIMIS